MPLMLNLLIESMKNIYYPMITVYVGVKAYLQKLTAHYPYIYFLILRHATKKNVLELYTAAVAEETLDDVFSPLRQQN